MLLRLRNLSTTGTVTSRLVRLRVISLYPSVALEPAELHLGNPPMLLLMRTLIMLYSGVVDSQVMSLLQYRTEEDKVC